MKALICSMLALSIPSVHAIQIIKPIQKQVVAKTETTQDTQAKKKALPSVRKNPKKTQLANNNNPKPIAPWQWAIYEKHKVPVEYRYILEAIRMNECNQDGGYCFRTDRLDTYNERWNALRSFRQNKGKTNKQISELARNAKPLDIACHHEYIPTGDGGVFQMNYIHGEVFDKTMIDLCNMRKAIINKDDKAFIYWRDKLFEDQMLWTLARLNYILTDDRLSWETKVYNAAWKHHSNPKRSKNLQYSAKAVRNWRKIHPKY